MVIYPAVLYIKEHYIVGMQFDYASLEHYLSSSIINIESDTCDAYNDCN